MESYQKLKLMLEQTTASCDGKLRIYDTSGSTPVLLKIMEGVIGSSESE